MNTIFRTLFVCFMLLALPFQGYASAGMLPRVASEAPPVAHAMAGLPPCHQAAMAHQAAAQPSLEHAQDHAGKPDSSQPDSGKHGAKCASCCIGAAMMPFMTPGLPLAPPQFVSIPFSAGDLPSVDPSLPERPPKTFLA